MNSSADGTKPTMMARFAASRAAWIWRLVGVLAVAAAAAAVAAYIYTVLFVMPVNVDETQRLARTVDLVFNHQPQRTDLWLSENPSFLLLICPLLTFFPPHALPMAMRALALAFMLLALAAYYLVLRVIDRENAWPAFLASLALVGLCPAIVFKLAELRPDTLMAACILLGLLAVFRSRGAAGRLVGWLLLGAAVSLRFDAALVLAPALAGVALQIRQGEIRARWLLAPVVPALATLGSLFLLYRGMTVPVLVGSLSIYVVATKIVAWYPFQFVSRALALPGAIGLAGILERAWQLRSGAKKDERPFNVALLGSALLLLFYHTFGARLFFLQTFWSQFYLLVPFAGLLAIKSLRVVGCFRSDGLFRRAFPAVVALLALNSMVHGIPRQFWFREYSPRPRVDTALTWTNGPPPDPSPEFLIFVAYPAPNVARFWRWLEERYDSRFTAYANDLVLPFGHMAVNPPHIFQSVVLVHAALRRNLRNDRLIESFFARFPEMDFVLGGKAYTPGGFLVAKAPDVLMADHLLSRLCRDEPGLRRMLRDEYRFVLADGDVPVYIRKSPR